MDAVKTLLVATLIMFCSSLAAQNSFQKLYSNGQDAARRGLHAKALSYYLRAEQSAKKNYEKNRVYQALADCYKSTSDYIHAIDYYTKLLSVYNAENRKKVLLNLSDLWLLTGQYQKVIDSLKPMADAPDETVRLNNLAAAYTRLGRHDEALEFFDLVLKNPLSLSYKIALQNKGYVLWQMHKHSQADSLLSLAVSLFPNADPNRYVCLANLAKVQADNGDYDNAIKNIESALQWLKVNLGEKHFDYLVALRKKAEILRDAGRTGDAIRYFKSFFYKEREYVSENFAYMTENERLNFWHSQKPLVDQCFALENADSEFLFDVAVFSKSVLTQANINFAAAVSKDDNLQQLYDKIVETKTLTRTASPTDRPELLSESEALEKQLTERFPDFKHFVADLLTDGKDVKKALKTDHEFAVEFVYYRKGGAMHYAAVVMSKNAPAKFVPLCSQSQIEGFVLANGVTAVDAIKSGSSADIRALYTDTILSSLIWDGILASTPQNSTLYFVPDGIFYNFGIENINFQRPDMRIIRLSSSRVLCKPRKRSDNNTALIIGGLDYNDASFAKLHDTPTDRSGSKMLGMLYSDVEWKPLPNTITETDTVSHILKHAGYKTVSISRGGGTEDFVKSFLPGCRLALLSTHGYSCGYRDIVNDYNLADSFTQDSTMLLSGIVLSGANVALRSDTSGAHIEDGYITALEISSMNLSQVDLIMLSACQTGLGQVSLDGSAGLPRGIKKAGANSVVVSLWEVNDFSTRIFSTCFFEYLCQGKSKYDALRMAQNKVKYYDGEVRLQVSEFSQTRMANVTTEKTFRIKNMINPYFWAPFIIIDGID